MMYAFLILKEVFRKHKFKSIFLLIKLGFLLIIRNLKWILVLLKSKKDFSLKVNGNKIVMDIKSAGLDFFERSLPKQLVLDGIREVEATKILKKWITKNEVIFEAGANIGYYALLESNLIGKKGIIYAIEPEPNNFDYLSKNISINKLQKKIKYEMLAVSDKNEKITMYVSKDSNRHNVIRPKNKNDKKIIIPAVSIDSYFEYKRKPTFIRMDIEGAECKILPGMKKTLKNSKNLKLFIELHPHIIINSKYSMVKFLKTLKKYGFKVRFVISHDTYIQHILGLTTIEKITIDDLINDERVTKGLCALEVFFEKNGEA